MIWYKSRYFMLSLLCYGGTSLFRYYYEPIVIESCERSSLPAVAYGSFKSIVADWRWFQVQHMNCESAEQLAHYIFNCSELDPHFTILYRWAAINLSAYYHRPDLAVTILEKSLASPVNAADWRILAYLAHYYRIKNPNKAYDFLEKACTAPRHYALLNKCPQFPTYLSCWLERLKHNS